MSLSAAVKIHGVVDLDERNRTEIPMFTCPTGKHKMEFFFVEKIVFGNQTYTVTPRPKVVRTR